jgi:hypothetical protein
LGNAPVKPWKKPFSESLEKGELEKVEGLDSNNYELVRI